MEEICPHLIKSKTSISSQFTKWLKRNFSLWKWNFIISSRNPNANNTEMTFLYSNTWQNFLFLISHRRQTVSFIFLPFFDLMFFHTFLPFYSFFFTVGIPILQRLFDFEFQRCFSFFAVFDLLRVKREYFCIFI